ncbi:aspartic peptidase A1 [Melampsora americana]|nr:aspartic peptidase A1 [Melampsora americana]
MPIQPYSSEIRMSLINTSAELQLGRAIARYGLFDFLNTNRSSSNLLSIVESHLPLQIKEKVVNLMISNRQDEFNHSGWKKNLARRLAIGLPALPPLLQTVGAVLGLPGTVLLNTLKRVGSNDIWTDPRWGSTTVKTESFHGDLAWSTKVSIGSPSQEFRLNIDSGSSDLFLFSPNCSTCSLSNHTAFLPNRSSTFLPLNPTQSFSQTFGDGSNLKGDWASDVVSLGNSIEVVHQTFGLATQISSDWIPLAVDGLMGIGPESNSIYTGSNSTGFFRQLINNHMLSIPVIGIAFVSPREEGMKTLTGEFTFGGVSEKWIRGGLKEIVWKKVTSQNFWGIALSGIFVNGQNVMSSKDPPRAILDTGTSLTLVSTSTAASIHSKIRGAIRNESNGIWKLPCSIRNSQNSQNSYFPHPTQESSSSSSSPNIFFEFGIGTVQFAIPAESLAYQALQKKDSKIDDDSSSEEEEEEAKDHQICYSGIQAGSESFVVLGDTFIKNQYLALRYDENGERSIGLGKRSDLPEFT